MVRLLPVAVVLAVLLAGCADGPPAGAVPTAAPTAVPPPPAPAPEPADAAEVPSPAATPARPEAATPPSAGPDLEPAPEQAPAFEGGVETIDADTRARMTGVSWRPGCPVALEDLRLLRIDHWDFDGQVQRGELVVHAVHAEGVLTAFAALFDAAFPIERMELVDEFRGSDDASMAANNTSGFNCRAVGGTERWSQHAYGLAIDMNPVRNPYITRSGAVMPPAGRDYRDRSLGAPGMIAPDGPVVRAFAAIGWGWGGSWSSSKDYQHFSATGR